jgi:hypothetical protein
MKFVPGNPHVTEISYIKFHRNLLEHSKHRRRSSSVLRKKVVLKIIIILI